MSSALDRRTFLALCAGAGIPLPLAERSWATAVGGPPDAPLVEAAVLARITKEQVAAAEAVMGRSFSEQDRIQMLPHLEAALLAFRALHQTAIPDQIVPAFRFHPVPPAKTVTAPPAGLVSVRDIPPPTIRSDIDLGFATVTELGALLRAGALSVRELIGRTITRLERLDPALHAVVTVTKDRAMQQADQLDAEARAGEWRGPLHGIPWGAKDLLAVPGYPTTWGSSLYRERELPETAAVVDRLDAAGAVLVAKLALGELAYGDRWYGGQTRNPWRAAQGSTGSSAGSAVSVAAGLLPFAIGSETLGSILSPCARVGVSGLRPTYGRVSRHGAMSLAWTLDKLGPIARSAEDLALIFAVIQGEDERDPSSHPMPFAFDHARPLSSIRLCLHPDLGTGEPAERAFVDRAVAMIRRSGVMVREIVWPDNIPSVAMDIIMRVEGAAAFEQLTVSHRDDAMLDQSEDGRPNVFRAAHFIPAVQYVQANRVRAMAQERLHLIFEEVDVVLAPPMSEVALVLTNLTGHPAVTIPVGGPDDGAQHGLAMIGALWREDLVLRVAHAWQLASAVHRRRPPAFS